MQLFSYFRSSASFRVRIALALKGLPYDYVPVQIVHNEQFGAAFDALARAQIRALAQDIACEIHPLNNLRVLRYLVKELKVGEDDKNRWYRHWVETGLEAVERQLVRPGAARRYCHGDTPTLADCVLVPQIFNAQRFDCPIDDYRTLAAIFERCMALEAFRATQPNTQADAF